MRLPRGLFSLSLFLLGSTACSGGEGQSAADAGLDDQPLGFVTLSSRSMPARLQADATFLPGGPAFLCTPQVMGECTFYSCARRPPSDAGVLTSLPHAGAIAVTGGIQAIHLVPATDGAYDSVMFTGNAWNAGQRLSLEAAGALIPAFQGSVTAPALMTVTSPELAAADWEIDRTQDVVFAWSGLTTEEVVITVGANTATPMEVECVFPGARSSGTVPSTLLARLPVGAGYFEVRSQRSLAVAASEWKVTFRADLNALATDGSPYNGGAKFQ